MGVLSSNFDHGYIPCITSEASQRLPRLLPMIDGNQPMVTVLYMYINTHTHIYI